jgi:peptidoglycan-associated lipoprotein
VSAHRAAASPWPVLVVSLLALADLALVVTVFVPKYAAEGATSSALAVAVEAGEAATRPESRETATGPETGQPATRTDTGQPAKRPPARESANEAERAAVATPTVASSAASAGERGAPSGASQVGTQRAEAVDVPPSAEGAADSAEAAKAPRQGKATPPAVAHAPAPPDKHLPAEAATATAGDSRASAGSDSRGPAASASLDRPRVVRFGLDQSRLSSKQRAVVRRVAETLRAQPNLQVILRGHTDDIGSTAYNLALGRRRARAVARLLRQTGIPGRRIEVVSLGDKEPAIQGQRADSRALNRRVEIRYRATDGR